MINLRKSGALRWVLPPFWAFLPGRVLPRGRLRTAPMRMGRDSSVGLTMSRISRFCRGRLDYRQRSGRAGNQGHFWLFNRNHAVRPIQPAEIVIGSGGGDGSCPGAPDWSVFEPRGLGMREIGRKPVLVAINHGGRETLEFFDVDMGGAEPMLTWTGCAAAPEGQWPDDIAVMSDGSLFVTSLWDPADETRVEKLVGGKPVGGMLRWSADGGWAVVPGYDGLSGPNGISASADGKDVFIAAWSGKKILHAKADDMAGFTEVAVDFPPDNLNWSEDGKTILVAGVTGSILEALQYTRANASSLTARSARTRRFSILWPGTGARWRRHG